MLLEKNNILHFRRFQQKIIFSGCLTFFTSHWLHCLICIGVLAAPPWRRACFNTPQRAATPRPCWRGDCAPGRGWEPLSVNPNSDTARALLNHDRASSATPWLPGFAPAACASYGASKARTDATMTRAQHGGFHDIDGRDKGGQMFGPVTWRAISLYAGLVTAWNKC